MAALKADPLSSGRGDAARRGWSVAVTHAGARGESITQRRGLSKRRVGSREKPRRGWRSRERQGQLRIGADAVAGHGRDSRESRSSGNCEGGTEGDGLPADPEGKTPRRMKNQEGNGLPCLL
jgi:hypothetical protein